MRKFKGFNILLLSLSFLAVQCQNKASDEKTDFHQEIFVVDGHNDALYTSGLQGIDIGREVPEAHTDLIRLREGGVNAQVFAVWTDGDGDFQAYKKQYKAFTELLQKYPEQIEQVKSFQNIHQIRENGKIAAILGVEGGHMMENNLSLIDSFKNDGVKIFTLTWNNSLSWAISASDEFQLTTGYTQETSKQLGLNEMGKEFIKKLNQSGIVIDLSHASRKTFSDVMEITTKPVVASHSNAFSLSSQFRNLTDEQLLAIQNNGGLVGINFYSGFLDPDYEKNILEVYEKYYGKNDSLGVYSKYEHLKPEEKDLVRPDFEWVLDHIDYIVKLIGVDYVSLGSDFDGIDNSPKNLNSVRDFPNITQGLQDRGYSEEEIRKIMGENWLRVFTANEVN